MCQCHSQHVAGQTHNALFLSTATLLSALSDDRRIAGMERFQILRE